MWHCHILEHEDNERMRPYCTGEPNGAEPTACTLWDQLSEHMADP